ncbi:MAG: AsmA family protein [Bacteroidia bacterium]|nr:AsmA family protein [Bacteroidia bacterium]
MNTEKKSTLKKILKISGISILSIVLVLAALPFLFKDKIIQKVKDTINENLNAKVDFGNFDLSIISSFPDFKFEIENVSVVGIQEFEKDTLAYIQKLDLNLNLKSVLSGDQYQINKIIISSPKIKAIVLPNGKANWDIAKTDTTQKATTDTSAATPFKLSLKKFKIENAQIIYDDQQGKMYSEIKNLNYDLSGDFTQDVFDLIQSLSIDKITYKMDNIAYLKDAKFKASANMNANMKEMKFTFKENEFDLNDFVLKLDGFVAMPNDSDMVLDLKTSSVENTFKSLLSLVPAIYKKEFAGLQASGKVSFYADAKGTYNNHSYPAFNVKLLVENGMFKYPSLPKSVNNVQIDLNISNKESVLDKMLIDLKKFHVEMAQNPVDMRATIRTPMSDPNFDIAIKGKIDLASVKDFVPLEKGDELNGKITADIELAGKMSDVDKKQYDKFKANGILEIADIQYKTTSLPYQVNLQTMLLNFTTQFVELKQFSATVGKSDFNAKGKIDNLLQYAFKNELLKGEFEFTSKLIDVNELMASSTSTSATTQTTATSGTTTTTSTTTASAVDIPANIDFVLNAKIDKVIYDKMDITDLKGKITIREKRLMMDDVAMNILGGKMIMDGYYDSKDLKKPKVAFNFKVENFDIQKTFETFNTVQKLAPVAKYAKGFFTATLENFNVSLNEKMEPDLNSVDAYGVIKTNNIIINGFEPANKLAEALKNDNLKTLHLQNLNLSYKIKNGRMSFEPFTTKVNQINTTISGSTGLDQTIDYKWAMEIPKSMFGNQANNAMSGLLAQLNQKAGTNVQLPDKINVDVLFGGTITKPTVKTSIKDFAQNVQQDIKEQVTQAIVDKAAEEAQKILEEAQKQVDKLKADAQNAANQLKQEAYKQADELENKGANPLEKMANKKLAQKMREEADKKAQKIIEEANTKADKIMADAKAKADEKLQKK